MPRMTAQAPSRSPTFLLLIVVTLAGLVLAEPRPALAAPGWTWPVPGEVITAYSNGADPYAGGQHRGIDVAASSGTPVAAAVAGTVRFVGTAGSSGLTVSVRTADGRFDTSYLHLSSAKVREGDRVGLGERVGSAGTSGRRSTVEPHLHFGVREAGSRHAYLDPLGFLPPPGTPPVRELPRLPGPLGVPVRVGPAPERVRVPSSAQRRAPARRRVRVPAGRRIRVPAGRRIRVPVGGRAPLPRIGPAPLPVTGPRRVARPSHAPSRGPAPAPEASPREAPERAPAERPHPSPQPAGGLDLGWALACVGLLLAAACLGGPGAREGRGQRRRLSLGSLLRPLLGRR